MDNQKKPSVNNKDLIKQALADQLGVELEDIGNEDFLIDDLNIKATELSELTENLSRLGIDTSNLYLAEIETVNDLIEALSSNEYTD